MLDWFQARSDQSRILMENVAGFAFLLMNIMLWSEGSFIKDLRSTRQCSGFHFFHAACRFVRQTAANAISFTNHSQQPSPFTSISTLTKGRALFKKSST